MVCTTKTPRHTESVLAIPQADTSEEGEFLRYAPHSQPSWCLGVLVFNPPAERPARYVAAPREVPVKLGLLTTA